MGRTGQSLESGYVQEKSVLDVLEIAVGLLSHGIHDDGKSFAIRRVGGDCCLSSSQPGACLSVTRCRWGFFRVPVPYGKKTCDRASGDPRSPSELCQCSLAKAQSARYCAGEWRCGCRRGRPAIESDPSQDLIHIQTRQAGELLKQGCVH